MERNLSATWRAILWGGFVAGSLDIFAASLINWRSPVVILQAIASGVLNKPAFYDGAPAAVLGLLLQWLMGVIIAAIYAGLAPRFAWVRRSWWQAGLAYGVIVYFVMTYVVRPLSAAWPPSDFSQPIHWTYAGENLAAMFVFGLIVAYCAAHIAPQHADSRPEPAGADNL